MVDGIQHWPLFIASGLLLNLTPGVDMALVLRSAAAQGGRAGVAAALGICAGCGLHVLAAALGLSALLAGSATAFGLLRWVGAAYLLWLGIGLLRSRLEDPPGAATPGHTKPDRGTAPGAAARHPADAAARRAGLRRLFAQGLLTNALNPKVALFFLAFVPQFITAQAPDKPLAFVLLGAVFIVDSLAVLLALAWAAAALRRRLGDGPGPRRLGRWLNRGVGALFIGLGLKLALDAPR